MATVMEDVALFPVVAVDGVIAEIPSNPFHWWAIGKDAYVAQRLLYWKLAVIFNAEAGGAR